MPMDYRFRRYPWETQEQSHMRITGREHPSVWRRQEMARLRGEPAPGGTVMPGTTVSETSFTPSGQRPTRPKIPEFTTPEFDEREVSRIAAREAAPNVRRLRDVTARAIGQNFANPNVRRLTVREALQGFGSGLGSILTGSQRAAVSQYMPRYQAAVSGAQTQYGANVNALMQEYNQLYNEFIRTGTTRQTSRTV